MRKSVCSVLVLALMGAFALGGASGGTVQASAESPILEALRQQEGGEALDNVGAAWTLLARAALKAITRALRPIIVAAEEPYEGVTEEVFD